MKLEKNYLPVTASTTVLYPLVLSTILLPNIILVLMLVAVIPPAILARALTVAVLESPADPMGWIDNLAKLGITGVFAICAVLTYKLIMHGMNLWAEARKSEPQSQSGSIRSNDFTTIRETLDRIDKHMEHQTAALNSLNTNIAVYNERMLRLLNANA